MKRILFSIHDLPQNGCRDARQDVRYGGRDISRPYNGASGCPYITPANELGEDIEPGIDQKIDPLAEKTAIVFWALGGNIEPSLRKLTQR